MLTHHYRCKLYNKNKQVNLNILQADKEGCPFKIILGNEEVKKEEITLVRRDNIERKITINLAGSETEEKCLAAFERYTEEISKVIGEETKKEIEKKKYSYSFRKGEKTGKILKVITSEVEEFKKNLYQKSADFRDKHIYPTDDFAELEKKIKEGVKGFFLIPFCNNLDCEENIKIKVLSYSIRCISLLEKSSSSAKKCLFCQLPALTSAYLGRSY